SQTNEFPGRLFVTWPAALTHSRDDEAAFRIEDFGQETLTIRTQDQLAYLTCVCCAHCHEEVTPRGLNHHLKSSHGLDVLSASHTTTTFYQQIELHWYWNPWSNLNLMSMDFRYVTPGDN
ncbi:hypothetical protein F5879DRAFT_927137, partial [Lentinula edodes]